MRIESMLWILAVVFLAGSRSVHGDCCGDLASIGFSSNLPIIVINTGDQWIPDEPKIDGWMCTCSDTGNYDGRIGVEMRGSTSARDFQKKSYAVETRDDQGKDLKTDLLGFPMDSDWVLYGPEMDKSLGLRNVLAYRMARSTGQYASNTRFCEVFVVQDGGSLTWSHYNGVYVLAEKIKKGKERVDIVKRSEGDITGGYIIKHDNNNIDEGDQTFWVDNSQLEMIVVYPKKDAVTGEELGYLKGFLDQFEGQLFNGGDYQPYIDMGTFIDYFLLTEITKNPDGYRGSTYMYKNQGGPLSMGPAWDYNEAFGMCCGYPIEGYNNGGNSWGSSGGSAISPEGWRFNICNDQSRCAVDPRDGVSQWYRKMWESEGFRAQVANRWRELRGSGALGPNPTTQIINSVRQELSQAVQRNSDRWGLVDLGAWSSEMDRIETWTMQRFNWLDSQLMTSSIPPYNPGDSGDFSTYPAQYGGQFPTPEPPTSTFTVSPTPPPTTTRTNSNGDGSLTGPLGLGYRFFSALLG